MKTTEVAVIGAGPAGLAAAIEAAKAGAKVTLIDENAKPGGQLFKQIHKFFGSQKHGAGIRGIQIGRDLCSEAERLGVELRLNTTVYGLFADKVLGLTNGESSEELKAGKIIIAAGATENALAFPGWTLCGVMTAGAAQTMVNIHRVLPGRRVLMVGGGNVGLIVSYQLMQAGTVVVAVIEAASTIGGYEVHAAKLARAGVQILTSHTVKEAKGESCVESAVVVKLNDRWQQIDGTEMEFDVDTICLAVGLTPLAELPWMAGCEFRYAREWRAHVPILDDNMQSTQAGIYIVGDAAGIEEASTAMEEGRIAGVATAESLGYIEPSQAKRRKDSHRSGLAELRVNGELSGAPMVSDENGDIVCQKPMVLIECGQHIPCNPCETSCPQKAITVGKPITNLPVLDADKCVGCGVCVAACPGLAIFLLNMTFSEDCALVTIPYEYLPLPKKGDEVNAVNKTGEIICRAKINRVQKPERFDKTALVSLIAPKKSAHDVRGIALSSIH